MYADRMRIVVELGGSIARGQREERKRRPTQNTPVGEETAVVRASVPAAFGRLDRPTDEIKRREIAERHQLASLLVQVEKVKRMLSQHPGANEAAQSRAEPHPSPNNWHSPISMPLLPKVLI